MSEQWTPLPDGYAPEGTHDIEIDMDGKNLTIISEWMGEDASLTISLPPDLRLCKRTPVQTPEPDWSKAPHADCFIVSEYGDRMYYFCEDDVTWLPIANFAEWLPDMDDVLHLYCIEESITPIRHLDWRTTLRKRPEASD